MKNEEVNLDSLVKKYASLTDVELQNLAKEAALLTPLAKFVLQAESSRRSLEIKITEGIEIDLQRSEKRPARSISPRIKNALLTFITLVLGSLIAVIIQDAITAKPDLEYWYFSKPHSVLQISIYPQSSADSKSREFHNPISMQISEKDNGEGIPFEELFTFVRLRDSLINLNPARFEQLKNSMKQSKPDIFKEIFSNPSWIGGIKVCSVSYEIRTSLPFILINNGRLEAKNIVIEFDNTPCSVVVVPRIKNMIVPNKTSTELQIPVIGPGRLVTIEFFFKGSQPVKPVLVQYDKGEVKSANRDP